MIYIIHGEDFSGSYSYLTSLLKNHRNHQKIYLEVEDTLADLDSHIVAQNIFAQEEIIICANFIGDKKIKVSDLKNMDSAKTLIFLEKQKVNIAQAAKLEKIKVLEFKLPATLFHFLDSISPKSAAPLIHLKKIKDMKAINWHLANRLMLLTLARLCLSHDQVQTLTKKTLATWQWQKIVGQAENFDSKLLKAMFNATLIADMMRKQGHVETDDQTLTALLLVKYLKPPQVIQ